MRIMFLTVALLLVPTTALAWDGPQLWYERADVANPGSGGIIGTGGEHDHGVTCLDCHQEREETALDVTFTFTPALDESGRDARYAPGQRYRVDVAMLGEMLGPPCDQYMMHINNFAATFETAAGQPSGLLESDSGLSAANCPNNFTDPQTGTTALYRDCEVVFPRDAENMTSWTFYWTAPAAGGEVRMFYGAVDGDCTMMSMGDAVVVGDRTLVSASASRVTPASTTSPAPIALASGAGLALLALAFTRRRRRR